MKPVLRSCGVMFLLAAGIFVGGIFGGITTPAMAILHSVITGPYENRSAANNIKEKITNIGFDPQLRTLCKKN